MSEASRPTAKELRQQRLAKALRDNLKRRKAQVRERASEADRPERIESADLDAGAKG